ncbi:LOW QUALITY PROTEIN: hypothetical protein ACHAXR_010669 [Thalassiosira sp. AJA248-18]
MIYNAPGFIEFLATEWLVSIDQSGAKSLEVITQLLIDASLALVEARSSESVKAIAKIMRKFDTKLSHRLCAILQLDNSQDAEKRRTKKKENKRNPDVVCWGADLDVPGERHDNDHPNFRDISLVPTKDELSFQGRSWLPLASGANSFVDDQAQCLLDRNFRLLREDAVGAMKENLVDPRRFKVWKNARIIGASCKDVHNPRGTAPLHFFVQLDLPQGRAIDWKRQRSFPYDGLVAFHNGKQDVMASIFIRKCDQPNQWLLCPGGPVIGVIFHHDNDVRTAISDISVNKDTNKLYQAKVEELKNISNPQQRQGTKEEMAELKKIFKTYNLIEVSDSFFAYRPVLEALTKMISVPLAEELVHIQKYPERPSYLPKNVRLPQAFKRLEVDLEQWSESSMLEKTTLDESQSKALHMALTSRVALIQGPPGCGKTFIGSLLAQIIRDNTDESILCVCYTNHALDQFLDHMLKQGETRLVRIGGRTKSDALKDYELKSLSKREKSLSVSDADRRMRSVVAQMHRCKEEITDLLEALEMPLEWKYATEVFDSIDGQLYLNFDAAQDDGFAVVGRNNAKINDEALFNMWKNGSDCPEWLYDILRWEDDFENLWMLQPAQRLERLNEWKGLQFEELTGMIHDARQRYEALSAEKRDIGHEIDSYVLKEARIVGATTTGAAKYCDLLANKSASVVIVEEAGEVLEPHVLTAMTEQKDNSEETKHLILIGDHLQLRPKLESYSLTKVSGLGLDFDVSLFERLILSGYESAMLQVQHRMRPCIADIIRRQTYPTLKDHPSVFNYPSTLGVPRTSNLLFLDHCHPENGGDDATTTKSNTFEASMCVEIVRFLLLQGYCHDQVTILTPYVGQIMAVVREMKRNLSDVTTYVSDLDQEELLRQEEDAELDDVTPKEKKKGTKFVRCASIDNFQGEESDVVIICLVRSNKQGNIGFLKEEQRVNVLLSRAKGSIYGSRYLTCLNLKDLLPRPSLLFVSCILLMASHIVHLLKTFELCAPMAAAADLAMSAWNVAMHVLFCAIQQISAISSHTGNVPSPVVAFLLIAHETTHAPNFATKIVCLEIVEDTILPCGHAAKSPTCDSVRNDHSLKELAQKCDQSTFHVFSPCGHECETTCGNAKSDTPLCPGLCGKMLECGHPCQHRAHRVLKSVIGSVSTKEAAVLYVGHHVIDCHVMKDVQKFFRVVTNAPPCAEKIVPKRSTVSSAALKRQRLTSWTCLNSTLTRIKILMPTQSFYLNAVTFIQWLHLMELWNWGKEDNMQYLKHSEFCISLDKAYEKDHRGNYIGLKDPSTSFEDAKPKSCPDCREIIQNVNRYGRLSSFQHLRFLERKHMIGIETRLKKYAAIIGDESDQAQLKVVVQNLGQVEKDIIASPMRRVFEACSGKDVDVAKPPSRPTLQLMRLRALCFTKLVQKNGDSFYNDAIEVYEESIIRADADSSRYVGSLLRLDLCRLLMNWNSLDIVKVRVVPILERVIQEGIDAALSNEAAQLKKKCEGETELKGILRAMNVIEGYNYGGGWNSHWYECPNGHPYFIGECGGAMQLGNCIECGEQVGGGSHHLLATNRSARGAIADALR